MWTTDCRSLPPQMQFLQIQYPRRRAGYAPKAVRGPQEAQ
jgi:hypothetical protein